MAGLITIDSKLKIKQGIRRNRKVLLILGLVTSVILIVLVAAGIYLVVIPAQHVSTAAQAIMSDFSSLQTDFQTKNLAKLDDYVSDISAQLTKINEEVDRYEFLQNWEPTKGYYQNLQVLRRLSQKTQALVTNILPDLKTILSAAGYSLDEKTPAKETKSEDNLKGIIKELPKFVKLYESSESQILEIVSTFNQINPNYIPELGTNGYRSKIVEIQRLTADFPELSSQLKETLKITPKLLGSDKPANYLIVFQNEKEMRASGGLLTAYGNLVIDKGEFVGDIKAKDMWDLEAYVSYTLGVDVGYRNIYGQNALMNAVINGKFAGCGSNYLRAQDSGIYPDLHQSLDMFKDYYDVAHRYNPKAYPGYDFVIIVNTYFASDLVSLVEPLKIPKTNEVITSKNLAKAIFTQTSSAGLNTDIRKDFIAQVATTLKDQLTKLSATEFPKMIQRLIRTIQAKNIAFYSKNSESQAYFDEFGLSGRVEKNFSGDYFQLNEAQNCALKSNFFVYDKVTQNIKIQDKKPITKTVTVEWINEHVYKPGEENFMSATSNFLYRAWIRFFAPVGTKFTGSDGYEKSRYFYYPFSYYDKIMDKETYDNIIWFDLRRLNASDPIRRGTLNVSYTLPDKIKYDKNLGYRMLLQKHPGKAGEKYTINIDYNGAKTTAQFTLDRDKVLTFKDGVVTITNFDTRLDPYYDLMKKVIGTGQ